MGTFIDLTGQKFGRLTVLKRDPNKTSRVRWLCKCDCGNPELKSISSDCLRSGNTKSCGCLQQESRYTNHKKNLIGKRFGKLTVLSETNDRERGKIIWVCQCDCGNTKLVNTSSLTTGITTSCGCEGRSRGEAKIEEILIKNGIKYQKEKAFDNFVYNTNRKAKFDFYIIDDNYIIEFDGRQHFEYDNTGWNNLDNLRKNQEHDKIKNEWCKSNNIPLIRIPYTHFNDLCIEDLKLETSQFIL